MATTARQLGSALQRYSVRVCGQVQGVGFRPFVYRLATDLGLTGWVMNDGGGVQIQIQGVPERLSRFLTEVRHGPEPLAKVERLNVRDLAPRSEAEFAILTSTQSRVSTGVVPDTAVCPDCLAELFDPRNRRYRYPFINCTQCGPRYTIVGALPYDRANTSMAAFALCGLCQSEYEDPRHRRFHAEPNACAECGPRLRLLDAHGSPSVVPDVIAAALARIRAGEILAFKGLGGFHLVCDARNAEAVARLRACKNREAKAFGLMMLNAVSVARWAIVADPEKALLESAERPLLLVAKRRDCDRDLAGIAPGLAHLGVMLPYTPAQYLLFHEAAGRPNGMVWLDEPVDLTLVMTSANPSGEPLVIDNGEALERLRGIADAYVVHDRDILMRCDDSVVRWHGGAPAFVRRARGYTPRPVRLPRSGPSVLALGGWFKNTVCVTRDDQAFVSEHIGDLDNAASCRALEETVDRLLALLEVAPECIAHDLHPDFYSSALAIRLAQSLGVPNLAVQHHHAHVAAVAAEHKLRGPLLGLALDGVGLGLDGNPWGGEMLRLDGHRFTRVGHLRDLRLPGGARAAREPWRMAASALHAIGRAASIEERFPGESAAVIRQMLERGFNTPPTTSAGRLFDAAAGLLDVRRFSHYEGQAAMELEALAHQYGPVEPLSHGWSVTADGTLDLYPLLAILAGMGDAPRGASLFHATLAAGLGQWVSEAAAALGLRRVVLGGGCLLNQILSRSLRENLTAAGLQVYEAEQLPPNDGGLSLGQAWVAVCRQLKEGSESCA